MTTTHPDLQFEPAACLQPTQLLDLDDSKLRIQAMRITQLAPTDIRKAVLVHEFVKSMPFGCVAFSRHISASAVLKNGRGDCHTKGTLFVALLRSSGVPARLRFVSLSSGFMRGIIDLDNAPLTHAIGEAYLGGHWVQSDTYVADELLEVQALDRLRHEGQLLGYGIHAQACRCWSGRKAAHGQFTESDPSSMPLTDFGLAHDPQLFYASNPRLQDQSSWVDRTKWSIAASLINHRTQQLRMLQSEK